MWPDSRTHLWKYLALALAVACTAAALLWSDARSRALLENTLLLVVATAALSLPLGTLLAVAFVRTDLPGRRVGLVLIALMPLVPLYLQAAGWAAGFGLQGWLTEVLHGPLWLQGWVGAIWVHAMAATPWVMLLVAAALGLVEPELEELALLDGSGAQVFARVTLRSALPALWMAALWVAMTTAGEMTVTDLFAVRTYAEEIYTRIAVGAEPGSLPLAVLPGILLAGWLVLGGLTLGAISAPRVRPLRFRRLRVFQLGRWRWPLAAVAWGVLAVILGLPLGNMAYQAGVTVRATPGGLTHGWSILKCLAMIVRGLGLHPREFGWSLGIGSLAATADVLLALGLAGLARRRGARALPLLLMTGVGLAVPGPMLGLATIWLLNRPDWPLAMFLYDRSILAPWMVLSVRAFPAAGLVMWYAWESVPRAMLESAALDGAGPVRRTLAIVLPSVLPALVVAWLFSLAVALGDLAATILVVPPGVKTLSIRVFELLHYGVEDRVAGICLALVGLFAALAAAVGIAGAAFRRRKV